MGCSMASKSRDPAGRAPHGRHSHSRTSGSTTRTGSTSSFSAGYASPLRGFPSLTSSPTSGSGSYLSLSLSFSLYRARSPSLSYAHTHTKRRNNTNRHIYPTRHVNRADYIRALDADGRSHLAPQDATVTPRCVRGWLSTAVSWTRLQHLTLGWWHRRVLRADE